MTIADTIGRVKRSLKRRWAYRFQTVEDPHADDFVAIDGKPATWREFNAQACAAHRADEQPAGSRTPRVLRLARVFFG